MPVLGCLHCRPWPYHGGGLGSPQSSAPFQSEFKNVWPAVLHHDSQHVAWLRETHCPVWERSQAQTRGAWEAWHKWKMVPKPLLAAVFPWAWKPPPSPIKVSAAEFMTFKQGFPVGIQKCRVTRVLNRQLLLYKLELRVLTARFTVLTEGVVAGGAAKRVENSVLLDFYLLYLYTI